MANLNTLTIPAMRLSEMEDQIKRINNKAKKLGFSELVVEVSPSFDVEETIWISNTRTKKVSIRKVTVNIIGDLPNIPDYNFIGTIEYNPIVIHSINGEIPEYYRDNGSYCDHCKSMRRRNKTIILQNKNNGEYLQVGSTCIKDFLGLSVASILGFLESVYKLFPEINDKDPDYSYGNKEYFGYDIENLVCDTVKIIKGFGFVKTSDEQYENGKLSTKSRIFGYYFDKQTAEWMDETMDQVIDSETAINIGNNILDWVKTKDSSNEFFFNLQNIVNRGVVYPKHFGYIAGMVATYFREIESQVATKLEFNNEYLSDEIKSRITIDVKLLSIKAIDGFYGISYIHRFITKAGHEVIWFSTSGKLFDEIPDNFIKITGTIKEKKEYSGRKQTYLNRVKMS